MNDDFLSETQRAEDIILGSLGYGEEAHIVLIESTENGFKGVGVFDDGETFDFESEDELTELDLWALEVLKRKLKNEKKEAIG